MDSRFYGVIFRGQTERVEAHRLKHFETLHFFEPCVRIGGSVIVPVPHVQFCAGRVGEHFQNVPFFIGVLFIERVFLVLLPTRLPFAFYRFYVHTLFCLRTCVRKGEIIALFSAVAKNFIII